MREGAGRDYMETGDVASSHWRMRFHCKNFFGSVSLVPPVRTARGGEYRLHTQNRKKKC